MSSLILTCKYPANFAVPNSSGEGDSYVPETDLEAMTLRIVQLGVELRRGRLVKEVLLHLRGALQIVHPHSFEYILKTFTCSAEKQVNAEVLLQDLVSLDLDDEFVHNSPAESVTPWLRFYWEVLRLVLDVSRNNNRLESVYHDTALKAFKFCRHFSRKNEFRRLSEIIRYHLALSVKYPGQVNAVPLSTSPESHKLALELRFNQLTLACDLELWQEAFRTVEDIYGLQLLARKSVRQLTAPEYFDKLARIFAKSDNFLFLAATLLRQPQLSPEQEEVLVMATLASPLESRNVDHVGQSERLARIIGLNTIPTRASLLKSIDQRDILSRVPVRVQNLVSAFNSVSISKGIEALISFDGYSQTSPFIRACYENLLSMQFDNILKTRDSISLEEVSALACIDQVRKSFLPKFNIEMFLLGCNAKGIKINHMTRMIAIDRSIILSNPKPFAGIDSSMTWCHLQTEMRKLLQVGEVEIIKCQGTLAKLLEAEHENNLERRNLIEKRKEQLEAAAAEKDRQDAREKALKLQQEAEIEKRRQSEELARRDQERLEKERAEIRRLEAEKRLSEQEKMKQAAGARLNREKIAAAAIRLDYLERALRTEEIPLLEADYLKQKDSDKAAYDSRCKLISEVARAKFARDFEMKQKFTQSAQFDCDYRSFFAGARERRQEEFEARKTQAEIDLSAEKEKRRARILMDIENRRKIEAEREIARIEIMNSGLSKDSGVGVGVTATASSASGKYVPPSKMGGTNGWRRDEAAPASAPLSAPLSAPVSAPVSTAASAAPVESGPKKGVYIPRHKLNK